MHVLENVLLQQLHFLYHFHDICYMYDRNEAKVLKFDLSKFYSHNFIGMVKLAQDGQCCPFLLYL